MHVSINTECRRAWLQSAGSYQRAVNIFCVFFLRCGEDKEIGDSPAVAERLSRVTCPSTVATAKISCKLFHALFWMGADSAPSIWRRLKEYDTAAGKMLWNTSNGCSCLSRLIWKVMTLTVCLPLQHLIKYTQQYFDSMWCFLIGVNLY